MRKIAGKWMFIPPKYMLYTGFCCISSRPALKVCSDLKTMRQTIRSRYWPVRYLKYPSLKVMLKSLGSQMNQRIGSLGRLLRLQSRFVGAERIREVGHQRVTQRYRTAAASLAFQFRWTTYIIIYISAYTTVSPCTIIFLLPLSSLQESPIITQTLKIDIYINTYIKSSTSKFIHNCMLIKIWSLHILWMEEILHQLIGGLSHYL